jgi:excisionase family DNA binding protein
VVIINGVFASWWKRYHPTCREEKRLMALLTPRAAAERLGVGYSTLKRWVQSGRVRTTRTEGGHHRVAEAEIDRLLARQQH